jgi:L-fuculose-phosphate aldolase
MINNDLVQMISDISLGLFRKNFFSMYHGTISAKTDRDHFVINTHEAIFDEITEKSLCEIPTEKNLSWQNASIQSHIHASIYKRFHESKYIISGLPPFTSSYSLKKENSVIKFEDYFGALTFGEIEVYDPGDFDTWHQRSEQEIVEHLHKNKNHMMIIRGVGMYGYDRDIMKLVRKIAILENSCKLLSMKDSLK